MINKEDFIKKVKRQAGWIDEIDAYRLCSIFTDEFGVIYTDLPIEQELIYMWEKLNEVKIIPKNKVCNTCGIEKPLEDFYKDRRYDVDGRKPRCSECTLIYMRDWRNNKLKVEEKTL